MDRVLVGALCIFMWGICSVIDYGLFTKRNNDFCLMWSRDYTGHVSAHTDWCAAWRRESIVVVSVFSIFGPITLPVGLLVASADSPLMLEYTHIEHAYSGRKTER